MELSGCVVRVGLRNWVVCANDLEWAGVTSRPKYLSMVRSIVTYITG